MFRSTHLKARRLRSIHADELIGPVGFLVYKSRFIPKILGILLMIAGSGYLLSSFTFLILPQYTDAFSPIIALLEMAELPIIFWLLIVGAKAQSEERQIRP